MKPFPPDTSITSFEPPRFATLEEQGLSRIPELPQAEGFAPLDPNNPTPQMDATPVVQKAVFQDFSKLDQAGS